MKHISPLKELKTLLGHHDTKPSAFRTPPGSLPRDAAAEVPSSKVGSWTFASSTKRPRSGRVHEPGLLVGLSPLCQAVFFFFFFFFRGGGEWKKHGFMRIYGMFQGMGACMVGCYVFVQCGNSKCMTVMIRFYVEVQWLFVAFGAFARRFWIGGDFRNFSFVFCYFARSGFVVAMFSRRWFVL